MAIQGRGSRYYQFAEPGNPTDFGVLLRRLRMKAGMSQNRLGHAAGINASYVNRLESGDRTVPTRQVTESLARALHLTDFYRDALLFAADVVPDTLRDVGFMDTTLQSVLAALNDDALTPERKASLRAVLETICVQWRGQTPVIEQVEGNVRVTPVLPASQKTRMNGVERHEP